MAQILNRYGTVMFEDANKSLRELIEANKRKLSEANLVVADLRGIDLVRANLKGANLAGADLTKANWIGVDLSISNQ
jgi:uncharacterized protein YjbI with pentapeptide repeats